MLLSGSLQVAATKSRLLRVSKRETSSSQSAAQVSWSTRLHAPLLHPPLSVSSTSHLSLLLSFSFCPYLLHALISSSSLPISFSYISHILFFCSHPSFLSLCFSRLLRYHSSFCTSVPLLLISAALPSSLPHSSPPLLPSSPSLFSPSSSPLRSVVLSCCPGTRGSGNVTIDVTRHSTHSHAWPRVIGDIKHTHTL